jgi:type I restriction enzyme M protein
LKEYSIPLPPVASQRELVTEIDAGETLVNVNRELLARFDKKIQATLARVLRDVERATAGADA